MVKTAKKGKISNMAVFLSILLGVYALARQFTFLAALVATYLMIIMVVMAMVIRLFMLILVTKVTIVETVIMDTINIMVDCRHGHHHRGNHGHQDNQHTGQTRQTG